MKRLLAVAALIALLGTTVGLDALAQTPTPSVKPRPRRVINLNCMQTAVEKRDNTIIAGVVAWHTSVEAALKARRDALKTAWSKSDRKARRADIAAAWKTARQSIKTARHAMRVARKAGWDTFKIDRKACGTAAVFDDGTNEAVDIDL